jgi:hypothetical protein
MPVNPNKEREDSLRNAAEVRKAVVAFIKKYQRPPSIQELVTATGLSDKTVKLHRQRLTLGDGSENVFQQLTPDVLMAVYQRAVGYQHRAVKLISVSQGAGLGSAVERHEYIEHYPPDAAAAKLWAQLVEGFSERTQHEHSGEIANPQPPTIAQIVRYRPDDSAQ